MIITASEAQADSRHSTHVDTVERSLPLVTAYIPSLTNTCPFRISLHSWVTPVHSRATMSAVQNENRLGFEAKVFIDGLCVA